MSLQRRTPSLCLLLTLIFSCLSATVARGSDKALAPGYFNKQFNTLIRTSHPTWWGNWNLSSTIKTGAVGIIDMGTGTFKPAGIVLNQVTKAASPLSESLLISRGSVKKSGFDNSARGSVDSAEASIGKASGEASITWKFASQGAIFAQWQLTEHQYMVTPVDTINANMDLLKHIASNNNMLSPYGGIAQRFGVITGVIYAKSGLSIGSQSKDSEFRITADEQLLKSYLSIDEVKEGYYRTSSSGQIASFLWPADPVADTSPVPVAFTFASMDGERVLPNWIRPVTSFSIYINNHGSYYVDLTLQYRDSGGNLVVDDDSVTGFSSASFNDIPLEATDIELNIDFFELFHNGEKTLRWKSPLGSWLNGSRHIDIYGYWPGKTRVSIKEEPNGR